MERWSWVVLGAALLMACDDGSSGAEPPDAGADMAPSALDATLDEGAADAAADASGDMAPTMPDALPDAMPDATPDMAPPACDWPAPRLGDLPPAEALAADPASCGMPAYAWLDDPTLGEVVDRAVVQRWSAGVLGVIAAGAGIEIPRPLAYDVVVEQIVYVTQDRGERVEATALVGWPQVGEGVPPPSGMMALMHGTVGVSDDCSPSDSLEYQALTAAIAATGYLVVAPDFLGLKGRGAPTGFLHPYLVGEPTAIASLDAIRAAGRLAADAGACVTPEPVMLGISQGGHAALWTELLAPYYAAELQFAGTAAVVPPSDLVRQLEKAVSQRVDATFNALALLVGGGEWYGLGDRLAEVLRPPLDTELARLAPMSCDDDADFDVDADDYPEPGDVFTDLILEPAQMAMMAEQEPWGCVARENSLLHTRIARLAPDPRPSHGVLFVLGERDGLVDTPIERDAFNELCEGGWPLTYLECAGAGHVDAAQWSLPEIFDFLGARRAGEAVEGGCMPSAPVACRGGPM